MEKRKRPPLPLDASPQEKYDNLILTLFEEWQGYAGQVIRFWPIFTKTENLQLLGFSNQEEFFFFVKTLIDSGLISDGGGSHYLFEFGDIAYKVNECLKITFSGLNYCRSLLSSGKNSTRCFVAMKYADDMVPYYDEGIKKAVEETGFRPIRVDREHADNEQTINDFIIASIKQSRFCVADLTHQSHGAYFEAGYALGRGLKVIYTCHENDWDNLHFDVSNFQVLKYASEEELREKLSLKIQAFVMD